MHQSITFDGTGHNVAVATSTASSKLNLWLSSNKSVRPVTLTSVVGMVPNIGPQGAGAPNASVQLVLIYEKAS
jgi:hypothetical protein